MILPGKSDEDGAVVERIRASGDGYGVRSKKKKKKDEGRSSECL